LPVWIEQQCLPVALGGCDFIRGEMKDCGAERQLQGGPTINAKHISNRHSIILIAMVGQLQLKNISKLRPNLVDQK
jgi:hypothetical protein